MRITRLEAKNILSFDEQGIDLTFDPHLTVIAGPNGVGKSNAVRLIDFVETAIAWGDEQPYPSLASTTAEYILRQFAQNRHWGVLADARQTIRLGLALTTEQEKTEVLLFLRAAVVSAVVQERSNQDDNATVDAWVHQQLTLEKVEALFHGQIVLEHEGPAEVPWEVAYEFDLDQDRHIRWVLRSGGTPGIVEILHGGSQSGGSLPFDRLADRLFGAAANQGAASTTLRSPMPEFDLARLCWSEQNHPVNPIIHGRSGRIDSKSMAWRRFAELARLDPTRLPERNHSFAWVLGRLLRQGLVFIGEQFRGVGIGGSTPRQLGIYAWNEIAGPLPRKEPSYLPARLFQLKNGDATQRARYERIREMFSRLANGRSLDIQFEALPVPGASPSQLAGTEQSLAALSGESAERQSSPPPNVAIMPVVREPSTVGNAAPTFELPINLWGAGTWESVLLAESLADSADRFVILDEPALNLHPTWQQVLRNQLHDAPGQFLLITHSPFLLPVGNDHDMRRLVHFKRVNNATKVHRVPPTVRGEDLTKIIRELSLSTDARALLFASGVVLVEGDTERGAFPIWFSRSGTAIERGTPDSLDLAFHSVDGDSHFGTALLVLQALAIPWAIICDGAIFDVGRPTRTPHIVRQMLDAGIQAIGPTNLTQWANRIQAASVMDSKIFKEQVELARLCGVFTLAEGWTRADGKLKLLGNESFEAFVEKIAPGELAIAESEVGTSKVRKGQWIAEHIECPPEVDRLYDQVLDVMRERGLPRLPLGPS